MTFMLIALWLILGLAGQIMIWVERASWRFDRKNVWCPTPQTIFGIIAGSLLGVLGFIAGIVIVLSSRDLFRDTWWTRPICGDKP